jgi:hypothetical protein
MKKVIAVVSGFLIIFCLIFLYYFAEQAIGGKPEGFVLRIIQAKGFSMIFPHLIVLLVAGFMVIRKLTAIAFVIPILTFLSLPSFPNEPYSEMEALVGFFLLFIQLFLLGFTYLMLLALLFWLHRT